MNKENSLKEIQTKTNDWIKNHGGYWSPLSMLAAIMEELGEIAREINNLEGEKPKKINNARPKDKLGEELADLLFSIICIANYYKMDLSDLFEKTLKKYSQRDADRFT